MSLITTNNLCVSFGDYDLFRGVSVTVANDSRIGLIGRSSPSGATTSGAAAA